MGSETTAIGDDAMTLRKMLAEAFGWRWGLVCVLVLSACAGPTMQADFPYNAMLSLQDLPPGWFKEGSSVPTVPGATARTFGFQSKENHSINISDNLYVYSDEPSAESAYRQMEPAEFPVSDWKRPPEATFVPGDSRDQFRFVCLDFLVNGSPVLACTSLQQHRNLISLIYVNIDGQGITLTQFEQILKLRDQRLQQAATH
jgi:hypothetical protein